MNSSDHARQAGAPCAAIDLGTNTALLLVARHGRAGFEVVEDHCRTPRLGARVAARGTLDPEAVARTLAVLESFAARLRELSIPAQRVRVVATAVLRRASDAREFVVRARADTGLAIEILSGEEEARLGAAAVRAEGVGDDAVVIDVGGGSTEVACAALGVRASAPIGAVVLSESHALPEALDAPGVERLIEVARVACRAFPADIARARPVVALGGTAVNLALLGSSAPRFDAASAEGVQVAANQALRFARILGRSTPEARLGFPIEPERAGILPAGLAVLGAAVERVGAARLTVTGRGLRFGVVRELLSRVDLWPGVS